MEPAKSLNTIDEFREILLRSGLATAEEIARLSAAYQNGYLASANLPDLITAYCTFLIVKGVITPWQCEKLRSGRWKGFFLDNYRLLDHLGCDDDYSYYLARERETGAYYRLRITPPTRTQGTGVEYRVEERLS